MDDSESITHSFCCLLWESGNNEALTKSSNNLQKEVYAGKERRKGMKINRHGVMLLLCVLYFTLSSCGRVANDMMNNSGNIVTQPEPTTTISEQENAYILSTTDTEDSSAVYEQQIILGDTLLADGRYDEAILAFNEAIAISPICDDAYIRKAKVYFIKDGDGLIQNIFDCLVVGYELTQSERIVDAFISFANDFVDKHREDQALELLQLGAVTIDRARLKEWINIINASHYNAWESFMKYDIYSARYTGNFEWEIVDYTNFDAAAEYDIDGDGKTELILRYIFQTYDYGDIEIADYAYIVLKNKIGNIFQVLGVWNSGGIEHNVLRFSGKDLIVDTSRYFIFATKYDVMAFVDDEYTMLLSYTIHEDAESDLYFPIEDDNGTTYINIWGKKEKYLGNNYSTSNLSINSYEELVSLINMISSYPIIEFNLES